MHTLNRFLVWCVMSVLLLPLVTWAMSPTESGSTAQEKERIEASLARARSAYILRDGIKEAQLLNDAMIKEAEKHLRDVGEKRREYRLQVAHFRREITVAQKRSSGALVDLDRIRELAAQEKEALRTVLRLTHLRSVTQPSLQEHGIRLIVNQLVGESMGQEVDGDLRSIALRRMRQDLLETLQRTQKELDARIAGLDRVTRGYVEKLLEAEALYEQASKEYTETERRIRIARNEMPISDEQKAEEAAAMQEVAAQVRGVQGQLSRLNVRVTRKVERDLIRLKLLNPQEGEYTPEAPDDLPSEAGEFVWPVKGPISAGFLNPQYRRYFGFNHNAIDIVTRQLTPVRSAGDGVVFVVKDGGAKGFSYILIGHGGGYTTLYGHMYELHVKAGQSIKKGEVIGLSGGQPGTRGAGPYTTGAHLHFQVTLNGKYTDPLGILP